MEQKLGYFVKRGKILNVKQFCVIYSYWTICYSERLADVEKKNKVTFMFSM